MALAAIIATFMGMFWLGNKGRQAWQRDTMEKQSVSVRAASEAEHRRRQQEDDELITVILPTIRNV